MSAERSIVRRLDVPLILENDVTLQGEQATLEQPTVRGLYGELTFREGDDVITVVGGFSVPDVPTNENPVGGVTRIRCLGHQAVSRSQLVRQLLEQVQSDQEGLGFVVVGDVEKFGRVLVQGNHAAKIAKRKGGVK